MEPVPVEYHTAMWRCGHREEYQVSGRLLSCKWPPSWGGFSKKTRVSLRLECTLRYSPYCRKSSSTQHRADAIGAFYKEPVSETAGARRCLLKRRLCADVVEESTQILQARYRPIYRRPLYPEGVNEPIC